MLLQPWLAPDGREWGRRRYIRPARFHPKIEAVLPASMVYARRTPIFQAVQALLKSSPRWY